MALSLRIVGGLTWVALGMPAYSQMALPAGDAAPSESPSGNEIRTLPTVTVTNNPTIT